MGQRKKGNRTREASGRYYLWKATGSVTKLLATIRRWHPGLRWLIAVLLVLVGIVGLILPIMPGWPFIIAAVLVVGEKTRVGQWLERKIKQAEEWMSERRKQRKQ